MKKIIELHWLLICFFIFFSCKSVNDESINCGASSGKIFKTTMFPAKGVIVLVHGLNTKPSKMGDDKSEGTLAKMFLEAGYHVYRVTLPGHSGEITEMQNIKSQVWLNSALSQYREAAETADKDDIPIYLAAFSLGAAVYLNLMISGEDAAFEKMVLFAPAVAAKRIARNGIYAADIFSNDRTIIASKAPAEYRAQRGVSISAYKALFELEDNLNKHEFVNCNIPALVFIDHDDELISISALRRNINNFNLTNWIVETISNAGAKINPKYHHLIIDDKSLSPETWNFICKKILYFL